MFKREFVQLIPSYIKSIHPWKEETFSFSSVSFSPLDYLSFVLTMGKKEKQNNHFLISFIFRGVCVCECANCPFFSVLYYFLRSIMFLSMTKYFCLSIIFINPKQGKASFFKILFLFFLYHYIHIASDPKNRRRRKKFRRQKKNPRKKRTAVCMDERKRTFIFSSFM